MATTNKVSPEQILDALNAHPRVTSAELAEVLGIGQSTAAKHLATLEAAGTACREPGGRDGGRRLADRWSATTPEPQAVGETDRAPKDPSVVAAEGGTEAGEPGRSADRLGLDLKALRQPLLTPFRTMNAVGVELWVCRKRAPDPLFFR